MQTNSPVHESRDELMDFVNAVPGVADDIKRCDRHITAGNMRAAGNWIGKGWNRVRVFAKIRRDEIDAAVLADLVVTMSATLPTEREG